MWLSQQKKYDLQILKIIKIKDSNKENHEKWWINIDEFNFRKFNKIRVREVDLERVSDEVAKMLLVWLELILSRFGLKFFQHL